MRKTMDLYDINWLKLVPQQRNGTGKIRNGFWVWTDFEQQSNQGRLLLSYVVTRHIVMTVGETQG